MRKPDLEPILKPDPDDTSDTIPDIPDDPAPSGGGDTILPATPDTDYTGEPEPELVSDTYDASQTDFAEAEILPDIQEQGGGGAEAPEAPEEEELEDPREFAESLKENLDAIDPEEFNDFAHELLSELQKQDYSNLAGAHFPDLPPEEANKLVQDALSKLQEKDYGQLLIRFRENLTAADIENVIRPIQELVPNQGPAVPAPVVPEEAFPSLEASEESSFLDDLAAWLSGEDAGGKIDSGANLFGRFDGAFGLIKGLLTGEATMPGILANFIFDHLGAWDGFDQWLRERFDVDKDGKQSRLESFGRNLTMFFGGKIAEKVIECIFGLFDIRAKLPQPLKNISMNLRSWGLKVNNAYAHLRANAKYKWMTSGIERARQAELKAINHREWVALRALKREEEETEQANQAEKAELEANREAEAQAKEENRLAEEQTKEENRLAEEKAKEEIRNGEEVTQFQDDPVYQDTLRENYAQRDEAIANAERTRDDNCAQLAQQRDQQIAQQQVLDRQELGQWRQDQRDAADRELNNSVAEAKKEFDNGEGTLQERQSKFYAARDEAKQQHDAAYSGIDAAYQERSGAIDRAEGEKYDAIRSNYAKEAALQEQACETAKANAVKHCNDENCKATEAARSRADKQAEQTHLAADRKAEEAKVKADEATHAKADKARSDATEKRWQTDHSFPNKSEAEIRSLSDKHRDSTNALADQNIQPHAQQRETEIGQADTLTQQKQAKMEQAYQPQKTGPDLVPDTYAAAPTPQPDIVPQAVDRDPSQGVDILPASEGIDSGIAQAPAPTKGYTGPTI